MKIYKENGFVYIIDRDKFFRLTHEEFDYILSEHKSLSYQVLEPVNSKGSQFSTTSVPDVASKKWIRCPKKYCLIVDNVNPELKFNGIYDIKTIESIVSQYGKLPDQINILLGLNKLELLSEEEALKLFKEKDLNGKNKLKPKVGVRRRDDVEMSSSSDEDEESSESITERLIRKAARV